MFKQLATLLLTSSVMLSGCYLERDINYARPQQPLVKKRTISQLIHYKSKHRVKLTAKEISDLKDKVAQAQRVHDIHINIISQRLKVTKENSKTRARVNYLIRVLTRLGVSNSSIQTLDQVNWSSSEVKWEPEMIVIEIEWYDRHAVHCPGWNQIMDGRVAPEGEENFGCTSKSNLAKMVADPKDLIVGKDLESSDAQYNYMSIERYHTDKIKEIKIEKIDDDGA